MPLFFQPLFLVPWGRLSWLLTALERTLKQLVSYRMVLTCRPTQITLRSVTSLQNNSSTFGLSITSPCRWPCLCSRQQSSYRFCFVYVMGCFLLLCTQQQKNSAIIIANRWRVSCIVRYALVCIALTVHWQVGNMHEIDRRINSGCVIFTDAHGSRYTCAWHSIMHQRNAHVDGELQMNALARHSRKNVSSVARIPRSNAAILVSLNARTAVNRDSTDALHAANPFTVANSAAGNEEIVECRRW